MEGRGLAILFTFKVQLKRLLLVSLEFPTCSRLISPELSVLYSCEHLRVPFRPLLQRQPKVPELWPFQPTTALHQPVTGSLFQNVPPARRRTELQLPTVVTSLRTYPWLGPPLPWLPSLLPTRVSWDPFGNELLKTLGLCQLLGNLTHISSSWTFFFLLLLDRVVLCRPCCSAVA